VARWPAKASWPLRAWILPLLLLVPACGQGGLEDIRGRVLRNDLTGVRLWLALGGDPGVQVGGESLVSLACGPKGGLEVLRLLLDAGADPDARAPGDWTPLMHAASWGGLASCHLLVERGADPLARTADGRAVLDIARRTRRNDDVVAYLAEVIARRSSALPVPR
jgi:hypothetical protein